MPPSLARARGARGIRGFSMVEVLIAIVVLSFGMLGMVGMQAFAIQANREARIQSSAAVLARELAEMIRGNKFQPPLPSPNPYVGSFSSPLTPATASYCLSVSNTALGCQSAGLPATQLSIAQAELTEWLTRTDAELPGARVVICLDKTPYDSNGLPQWTCSNTGSVMVIKMGWTRSSTNRSAANTAPILRTSDTNSVPGLILAVTAGDT